ncbi:MAG: hypothetical protein HY290_20015 [Planctomycetia bacterium]|nr:hypothetical protein [Planctomycetia bacterium]
MKRTSFVWVAGHSSVGKRHFMDHFGDILSALESKLGLGRIESPISLSDHPSTREIEEAGSSHDCVLIHWQSATFLQFYELKDRNGAARHVVVHVHREIDEHKKEFMKDYPKGRFDHGHQMNLSRVEEYRKLADVFIDVANIDHRFFVIGRTEAPHVRNCGNSS